MTISQQLRKAQRALFLTNRTIADGRALQRSPDELVTRVIRRNVNRRIMGAIRKAER